MAGKIKFSKEDRYTIVPNQMLRSKELSWKAKGLMSYLLSMSEDWDVYKKDLANRSSDGYQSMLSAWNELEKHGYIETVRVKEGNLFVGYDYIVHKIPVLAVSVFTSDRAHENHDLSNTTNKKDSLEEDTKVSNVGLPSSTPTDGTIKDSDKCRLFVQAFNKRKIVNGKPSKYQPTKSVCASLRQRLKSYTSKDLLKVLEVALKDEYHIKEKFRYVTPEYILRENIIERYLNVDTASEKKSDSKLNYVP